MHKIKLHLNPSRHQHSVNPQFTCRCKSAIAHARKRHGSTGCHGEGSRSCHGSETTHSSRHHPCFLRRKVSVLKWEKCQCDVKYRKWKWGKKAVTIFANIQGLNTFANKGDDYIGWRCKECTLGEVNHQIHYMTNNICQ